MKAVFFDVDGTLLSHQIKQIPPSALQAISALRAKGILVFLATGRHWGELKKLPVWEAEYDGYITLNGQLCLDASGTPIFRNPIPKTDQETLSNWFSQGEFPTLLVEEEKMYINQIDEHVHQAQADISSDLPVLGTYTGAALYQGIVYGVDAHVLESQLHQCRVTRWNPHAVDIIPAQGGKVLGISKVLERFGLHPSQAAAFGDGENDREMLQYVSMGVAMGNADQETQNCARYVTSCVEEDGVARGLAHLGLI